MLVFAGDALVLCTVVKYKCLLRGDCWLFHDFEFAVCLILLPTFFFFSAALVAQINRMDQQVEEESLKAGLRPIFPPEMANSFSLAKRSEEKSGLRRPFQNAREKCSCWARCLRDQGVLSPERCNSVVLVRRTRPEPGASQVGIDVLTRRFPKRGREVKCDQKIRVWQDHAAEPTARVTVPQKPYASSGSGDSASEGLLLSKYRLAKQPAAGSSDPAGGKALWSPYGPAARGWDARTPLSAGFMSKLAHLHHLPGLWVRQRGCVTFPLVSSESSPVMSF